MYFPRLAVHNGMCFSIQQTECACPCCVLYTHSREAKRPLVASLPATPALGHRRCLIVFTPYIRCHEKDCNSRIYGGVTQFPHVHQQCRQDTSSTNPRIPPIHQDQHFHQNGYRPDTRKNRPARSHQARRDRTRHSAKCSLANELCYLTYFLLRLRDQDHIP